MKKTGKILAASIAVAAGMGLGYAGITDARSANQAMSCQAPMSPATLGTAPPQMSQLQDTVKMVQVQGVGNILTGATGMTLYTFTNDVPNRSNCTGQCAINWPPMAVSSAADLKVESGIAGNFGTTVRSDGTLQATYNGMPLYYYIGDKMPGDMNGEGLNGAWYIVKAMPTGTQSM